MPSPKPLPCTISILFGQHTHNKVSTPPLVTHQISITHEPRPSSLSSSQHHPFFLMNVLGVWEEGDPWKTPRSRWNAAKMKITTRRALDNEGFWWRWRVEVELWYGRWLEEMKEKV